ncbi:MAG: hypothetical protein ACRDK7_16205 [Solirubrobacteraceae bacterium]
MARPAFNPRSAASVRALSPRSRQTYSKALRALSLQRRRGLSASAAAREAGTTLRSYKRYADPALSKSGGRLKAAKGDRFVRSFPLVERGGRFVLAEIRGSGNVRIAAEYNNVLRDLLGRDYTRGRDTLERLRGTRISGIELETDPEVLEAMANRGELPDEQELAEMGWEGS